MWKNGKVSFLFTIKSANLLTATLPEIFKSNMSEPCVWRNNHLRIPFRVIHHKSFSYCPKNDRISNPQNSKLTITILFSFPVLPSIVNHRITGTENSLKNVSPITVINGPTEVSTSRDLPPSQIAITYFWLVFNMLSYSIDDIKTHR